MVKASLEQSQFSCLSTLSSRRVSISHHPHNPWLLGTAQDPESAPLIPISKQIPGLIQNMTVRCCDLPFPEQACCGEDEVSVCGRSS